MTTQTVEINVGDVGARGAEASAEAESQKMVSMLARHIPPPMVFCV